MSIPKPPAAHAGALRVPRIALPLLLIALLAAPALPARSAQQVSQPDAPGSEDLLDPSEPPAAGTAEPAEAIDEGDLEAVDEVHPAPAPEGSAGAGEAAPEPPALETDPAADLYLSRCAGCHTIGEGDLSGPDLAPSTGWPAADLAKAVERMEKNVGPMTDEEVGMLVDLLRSEDVRQRLSAARERQVAQMAASLEPPSARAGRELFHGGDSLTHRGLPCAACHRVRTAGGSLRGGTLASELTDAYDRLGEQAVLSAAETPGFALMRAAYGDRPVTRQEALHLAAYLEEVSERAEDAEEAGAPAGPVAGAPFAWWGAGATLLFLAAMAWLYRGRNRGVRAALVREAHSR